MGWRSKSVAGHFPAWTLTLDSMIAEMREGFQVAAGCTVCAGWRILNAKALARLREIKDGSYSLINRRTRCRLTEGCDGWNRFHYQSGPMRPLWDDATADLWIEHSWMVRMTPAGIDPAAWARADERTRARLVREARG